MSYQSVRENAKDLWRRALGAYTSRQTIAGAWDTYGRLHQVRHLLGNQHQLGDEWSRPDLAGLDIAPEQYVSYLDEHVFGDFLGSVDVLLEIGAGGGRFMEVLLPKCKRLIESDTSKSMLQLLRNRFEGVSGALEYLLLDGRGFGEVASGSVDAVFSYGVFVHLEPWDFYNYLAETSRVLRPGGRAIIQHPNTFSDAGWKQFAEIDLPAQLGRPKQFFSFNVMTPELMHAFSERAGLALVKCDTTAVRGVGISFLEKSK